MEIPYLIFTKRIALFKIFLLLVTPFSNKVLYKFSILF